MLSILFDVIVFGAGLVVGWNFLPQPRIVLAIVSRIHEWIRDRFKKEEPEDEDTFI